MHDLELLQRLGHTIQRASLCGLGQTAPNPVLSTMRHFHDEYRASISGALLPRGRLPRAGALCDHPGEVRRLRRLPPRLPGRPASPANRASRTSSTRARCIKCGACFRACRFSAVKH